MKKIFLLSNILTLGFIAVANASDKLYEGMAKPWQLNLQPPATPVMEELVWMHNILLVICFAIPIFVLTILAIICVRFNRKRNPVPSKKSHNTKLEIVWTVIPILVLVSIAIPSLSLHYYMDQDVDADMTIKASGHQWYWHYEYPDNGNISFDSYILKDNELKEGDHRLLAVDNRLVVPVDTVVKVLVTGADVIHAFAVPAFGVKIDAVPGRLNQTWFKANRTGRFYGQCSELCGVGHGFMPIVIDVVSKEEFANWVASKNGVDKPVEKVSAEKSAIKSKDKNIVSGNKN
ncbi:MAG: cytochrome c oxidase subunit II [Rickettsiales bacterium]